jgi:hypothetical protein
LVEPGDTKNRHGVASHSDQLPCDMKVLAALMALKAKRKTIKMGLRWRGFRRTLPSPFNRDPNPTN